MKKQNFLIIFTFATLVFLMILTGSGYLLMRFWASKSTSLSEIMLKQSQKTSISSQKILLGSYADYLGDRDEAKLEVAKGYIGLNNREKADETLNMINNLQLIDLAPRSTTILERYTWYKANGFPQLSHRYLLENSAQLVSRDELLALGNEYKLSSEDEKAYETFQKALGIDKFYPQSYQQLLLLCEKVDKASCGGYQKTLELLAW